MEEKLHFWQLIHREGFVVAQGDQYHCQYATVTANHVTISVQWMWIGKVTGDKPDEELGNKLVDDVEDEFNDDNETNRR